VLVRWRGRAVRRFSIIFGDWILSSASKLLQLEKLIVVLPGLPWRRGGSWHRGGFSKPAASMLACEMLALRCKLL
jgi:hypothetical protein